MTNLATSQALNGISFSAIAGFMSHLIAFEAKFGIAVKTFVSYYATKNATSQTAFIRTLPALMPKLLASETLDRRV